jgi:hypothetical protein
VTFSLYVSRLSIKWSKQSSLRWDKIVCCLQFRTDEVDTTCFVCSSLQFLQTSTKTFSAFPSMSCLFLVTNKFCADVHSPAIVSPKEYNAPLSQMNVRLIPFYSRVIFSYRRSQWPCGLRRGSSAARLLGSWCSNPTGGMDVCLLWVLCVVSATSWSLVQRSPTDCGVFQMCDHETSTKRGGPGPYRAVES